MAHVHLRHRRDRELENFFAVQRARVRRQLELQHAAYVEKIHAVTNFSDAYPVELRGITYGGTPTRDRFQVQEEGRK